MTSTGFYYLIFCLLSIPLYSQESLHVYSTLSENSTDSLYEKYFKQKGDPEAKILELIKLARGVTDKIDALQKIQMALILENQLVKPNTYAFELNLFAGDLIAPIHKGHALEYFKNAAGLADEAGGIEPHRIFHVYTNLAGVYQFRMEYDSAKFYYYKAIRTAPLDGFIAEASSYNNLGIFYSETNQLDSARIYFQKALLKLDRKENDFGLYSAIIDNMAQLDFNDDQYESALNAFRFNDSIYLARNESWNYIINKVRLLKTLEKLNAPGIHVHIQEFQNYIDAYGTEKDEENILDFYLFANDYYFNTGDRINQAFYRTRYRNLNALLTKRKLDQVTVITESLLALQNKSFESDITAYQLRSQKQKLELNNTKFTAIIAIISLILIILLLVVFIRKRRIEHQHLKQIAQSELRAREMEAKLIQQDLELKKRDLTNVVLHNTQVYDSNQKTIDRLHEISGQKNIDQQLHSLLKELQNQNQISDRSIGLHANIESVNEEFYENLKTKFPDLTKAEAELCGYIRINLSSKDISVLKNIAASSVKMAKTRLRKKLGITPEDDLYLFIREI